MGNLEKAHAVRVRRQNLRKLLLQTIKVSGFLSVALLAPNAMQMLTLLDPTLGRRKPWKYRVKNSLDRLVARGLVSVNERGGNRCLAITAKGERYLETFFADDVVIQKPRRWDGKWRVIVFDIPERRRNVRDELRPLLLRLGFLRLQDSVWVMPYDCEDVVTLLKGHFFLGGKLLYIIADSIEADSKLRKHFGL